MHCKKLFFTSRRDYFAVDEHNSSKFTISISQSTIDNGGFSISKNTVDSTVDFQFPTVDSTRVFQFPRAQQNGKLKIHCAIRFYRATVIYCAWEIKHTIVIFCNKYIVFQKGDRWEIETHSTVGQAVGFLASHGEMSFNFPCPYEPCFRQSKKMLSASFGIIIFVIID